MKIVPHTLARIALSGALVAAALLSATASASAFGGDRAVFVQSDNVAGNQVIVYDRAADGTLTQAGTYDTGGLGGALEGSVVDHLASQGSLTYDREDRTLYAVNAGSNTISVFAVFGDRLALRQVLSSGGSFPVSVTVDDGVVYVLNAKEGGYLQGFRVVFGRLLPIPGSGRALGLNPSATPQFTNTPGQVAFSPDGSELVVTTKENGSDVDVFRVGQFGLLSKAPVVNALPGAVPFAVSFDRQGHLAVSEAGPSALAIFELSEHGTIAQLDSVPTGQKASCWVVRDDGRFYASNTGSGSVSGFRSSLGGELLTLFTQTPTDGGPVDATVPVGGRFLYVQTGAAGIVDELAIAPGGTLSEIGSVTVPGAIGGEGIAAS
jgi:6-phosphogluconolactonase (cycloisomerase 2 family)